MHDALRIQDKIMNVESSFQMGYGVAGDLDMVDDELIPSQTIQLDFQPMSTGSETEGISHIFPTTSFWEHSEPQISNPANSGLSLETTNSDEMVDNKANSPISFQAKLLVDWIPRHSFIRQHGTKKLI